MPIRENKPIEIITLIMTALSLAVTALAFFNLDYLEGIKLVRYIAGTSNEILESTPLIPTLLGSLFFTLSLAAYLIASRRDVISCQNIEHEFRFTVSKIIGNRKIPEGSTTRIANFRSYKRLPTPLETTLYIFDPPEYSKEEVLEKMKLKSEIIFRSGKKSEKVEYVDSLKQGIRGFDLRPIRITREIPERERKTRKFQVVDELLLLNEFNEDEEFYFLHSTEDLDFRTVCIRTFDIELKSARFKVYRFGKLIEQGEISIQKRLRKNTIDKDQYFFEHSWSDIRSGTRIEIWWKWNLLSE